MPSEVEEIEAILNEKLRLVVGNRNGVDYAAGIDGIPEAAAAIAALRSQDRGAREMREDQAFAVEYADARGRLDYEHMARVLSGRLRRMDRRSAAANQRADRLEADIEKHREEHARFRASANEMWEGFKRTGESMLAYKRRAEEAEAKLAELETGATKRVDALPLSPARTEDGDAQAD